jgi:hypothetical protein
MCRTCSSAVIVLTGRHRADGSAPSDEKRILPGAHSDDPEGATMNELAALKIPVALRPRVSETIDIADAFCAEHLDAEYGELCRRLIARLARKRPSPLERGEPRIWAAGAVYALGSINFLFDRSSEPFMTADELAAGLGVAKTTMANKARRIRDVLVIAPMEPELSRREVLAELAWLVELDGFIVDARRLPRALQAEACRLGLVPDIAEAA